MGGGRDKSGLYAIGGAGKTGFLLRFDCDRFTLALVMFRGLVDDELVVGHWLPEDIDTWTGGGTALELTLDLGAFCRMVND